jgi:hypothetical protein
VSTNGRFTDFNPPRYVAYVYPGWHLDPYRPGVDEWTLLGTFRPYFAGHLPLPRPLSERYDDTDPGTVASQIDLALSMGIEAFTFFMYFGSTGFVMDAPMQRAFEASSASNAAFSIGGTLCVRLPHDRFPVPARDELDLPPPLVRVPPKSLEGTPIELLTLRDLETLMGDGATDWMEIALGRSSPRRARTRAIMPSDTVGGKNA